MLSGSIDLVAVTLAVTQKLKLAWFNIGACFRAEFEPVSTTK